MKFCKQCGASLEDDMMFCGQCGASQAETPAEQAAEVVEQATETVETAAEAAVVEAAAPEAAPAAQPEAAPVAQPEVAPAAPYVAPVYQQTPAPAAPKKSKKGLIIGLVAAVLVIAAAVVGVVFFLSNSKKETIDASKLVKIVAYGPDGYSDVAVMLANKDVMLDIINADDDENEYPGLWSYLYDSIRDNDDYPAGVTTWAEENESDYFKKGKVRDKTWKVLKDDKVSEAQKALKKLKVTIEDGKENGTYGAGDTITIKVKGDEDALKDAHIELKNTTFEYTFTKDDFIELIELDPFKGIQISCEGYEGNPTINYDIYSIDEQAQRLYGYQLDYESYYAAKNNGDVIIIKATPWGDASKGYLKWDGKYYAYDESKCTYTFTLSGLEELKEIDLFEGIQFEYSGMSPNLSISVDESGMPDVLSDNVYYSIDGKSYGYAIGDTVKVIATVYYESDFNEAGYTYDKDKMTYTFEIPYSAPHTLSATDKEINYDPELFGRMESAMDEAVGTDKFPGNVQAPGVIKSIDEFKYGEAELFSAIDDQDSLRNQIMQIVEIAYTYTGADGQDKTAYAYIVCQMYDIVVNEDGELEARYDNTIDVTYTESVDTTSAAFESYRNAEGVDSKKLR